jgi:transcriptional regulator with XRE-family HTH domain
MSGVRAVRAGTGVDGRQAALGDRLLRLRSAAGLSAAEVADAAGLDRAYYREIETGTFPLDGLTYLVILRLADALGVSPAAILAD